MWETMLHKLDLGRVCYEKSQVTPEWFGGGAGNLEWLGTSNLTSPRIPHAPLKLTYGGLVCGDTTIVYQMVTISFWSIVWNQFVWQPLRFERSRQKKGILQTSFFWIQFCFIWEIRAKRSPHWCDFSMRNHNLNLESGQFQFNLTWWPSCTSNWWPTSRK